MSRTPNAKAFAVSYAILGMMAGCTFSPGAASSANTMSIVDDSASDLLAGTLDGIVVDSLGLLAPDAVIMGGLHARAFASIPVTATTKWSDLTPMALGTLLGERYGEPPTNTWAPATRPYSLGIGTTNAYTLVYDGEVYLDGPVTIQFFADDFGIVEIDLGTITATLHSAYNAAQASTVAITPPAPGWYPIHGAMSQQSGTAAFQLSTLSNTGITAPMAAARFRARVAQAQGVVVSAASSRIFAADLAGDSIEATLVNRDFAGQAPTYDFAGIGNLEYALRYGGQLRVDTADTYVFSVDVGGDPTDYARLMIDGKTVAGVWPGQIDQPTSDATTLSAGWHDLILDYSQYVGTETIKLTMSTGTQVAQPITAAQLRPVRTGGLLSYANAPMLTLMDAGTNNTPGTAMLPFAIPAPSGALVDFADLFFFVTGEPRGDLSVVLAQPAGSDPVPMPATPVYDATDDYAPDRTMFAGSPAGVMWQAAFTDSVFSGYAGYIEDGALVVSYRGGPAEPFLQQMTYVSAAHMTPDAVALGNVNVTADLEGATMTIEVRTAPGGAWTLVDNGSAPAISAGDLIQYRLTISGDGWQYPTVDKIELDYDIAGS